jgi:hypothetical protein
MSFITGVGLTAFGRLQGCSTLDFVLVGAAEGFCTTAHGGSDLAICDRVRAEFAQFAGRLVPYFERTK